MSLNNNLIIELERFSGPMDLLLYLIRKEEMDIFDININQITKQYLDSIKQMKKLNLEVAGDFVAMASTLIQIKAKMLVPQYNEEGEIIENEDPRKDLVRRLIEYQLYQDAGKKLYQRPLLGRDVFVRGRREDFETPEGDLVMEEDNALYALISMYRAVVRKMERAVHKVAKSLKSIRERIMEIQSRLVVGHRVLFSNLLEVGATADKKGTKLITFLAMLELAKLNLVSLFQNDTFGEIHVEAKREITEDIISKVEGYESTLNPDSVFDVWLQPDEATPLELAAAQPEQQEIPLEAASDADIFAEEQRLAEADGVTVTPLEPSFIIDSIDSINVDALIEAATAPMGANLAAEIAAEAATDDILEGTPAEYAMYEEAIEEADLTLATTPEIALSGEVTDTLKSEEGNTHEQEEEQNEGSEEIPT